MCPYIATRRKLLNMTDRIFLSEFANAQRPDGRAVACNMAEDKEKFEFQRLHGMGRDPCITS